ncbi:unnamed protein product [Medioppia subpectinata]|uniref:Uncharacterized protein n=1 Tax=Medioppia subpectinata TaxID=1979941 RepID=A0A7R9KDX5_9ACAR|nr:unnamed protein product [Medioppia subpectinata]CAG2100780.1 unnamed protein product [Medioppia subpectinata]
MNDKTFLKSFILRQRLKKKREMETSISLEERKRAEERKRVEMKMSLKEIRLEFEKLESKVEKIRLEFEKLESKVEKLKQQKHILFSQLKKVLNEDGVRRRNRDLQWTTDAALFQQEQQLQPLPFAPPFNQQFFAQRAPPQQPFKAAFAPKPNVGRKRSHESRSPPPPANYKSACVTYTPNIGKVDFANQQQFYGMMTSAQSQRKYY